jgi:hypothetical protein
MHFEAICPRCRRVCFSEAEVVSHQCFDMADKIDAEIALANWDGKLYGEAAPKPEGKELAK